MHEPVLARLEEYLESREPIAEVEAHLRSCAECREELKEMRRLQAGLFEVFRAPGNIEPRAGFYARVMNQIESQTRPSIWNLFGESLFAKRLAYASMSLVVLLGTYFVSSQPAEETVASGAPEAILAGDEQTGPPIGADPQRDRETVLVNLATYQQQDYQ